MTILKIFLCFQFLVKEVTKYDKKLNIDIGNSGVTIKLINP